ncbi:hypothetical protein TNIN_312781 [Trichonephila inaurata madagascariensis]|uniref:Uncharacterized protein n=1 Tax=Trichonephila inaurata madagascariensis TaxID=2747483 RepID=A0A8X6YS82_9ARAC|nr:hypothetical protein TNIN_312781 [Trichonephila inaurata madagascariensis]
MNTELNRYQPFVSSEYKSLEFVGYRMNEHIDTNQQKTSFLYKEIEVYPLVENQKIIQTVNTNKYSQIELSGHERNPLFDKNKRPVFSEYSQMEHYNKEMNPQIDTNKRIVSYEGDQMEISRIENNPLFGKNQMNVSYEYSQMEYCPKNLKAQFNERKSKNCHKCIRNSFI